MAIPGYRGSQPTPYAPVYSQYYPNEYFSSVDVSLFFNMKGQEPLYIDEVTGLEYTLTERKVPVYGYADYTARRIVSGARIVQGQLSINLRPGDYLHELVNRVADATGVSSSLPSLADYTRPDPVFDPDGYAKWQEQQKNTYWQAVKDLADTIGSEDLSRQPYFTVGGFQIMLIYGDVDKIDLSRNSGRIRTIDGVQLFSAGQPIQLGPEAIQETFNFLAVDLNQDNRLEPVARRQAQRPK